MIKTNSKIKIKKTTNSALWVESIRSIEQRKTHRQILRKDRKEKKVKSFKLRKTPAVVVKENSR